MIEIAGGIILGGVGLYWLYWLLIAPVTPMTAWQLELQKRAIEQRKTERNQL